MQQPVRIAIIGMGGFAGVHHDVVRKLEASGLCRLHCTCDPAMASFTERQEKLDFLPRQVRLFTDYVQMLDACRGELDVVTVPTPIPLHAPMHRAAVERGLAVYLEKPPTVNWRELEAMLAVEQRAAKATNVGFNYIIEAERQELKARLVAGEFGRVRRVTVLGRWPRPTTYYERAGWAGRLDLHGGLVLDSPMGNAMAHLVHNALFWAGADALWSWAAVAAVQAELYRAHAIQGTDTVFLTAALAGGAELRLAMTHACDGAAANEETVVCERATLCYALDVGASPAVRRIRIHWQDGREEVRELPFPDYVIENVRAYLEYVLGRRDRPLTRLVDSRPFVHLNNLAYIAATRIGQVPAAALKRSPGWGGKGEFLAIDSIAEAVARFIADGALPSAQGLGWAVSGGRATAAELPQLEAAVRRLASG